MKNFVLIFAALSACACIAIFSPQISHSQNGQASESRTDPKRAEKIARLIRKAQDRGSARVIVQLDTPFVPDGNLTGEERVRQHSRIKVKLDEFSSRYSHIPADKVKKFKFSPVVAVEADEATLRQLENDPDVVTVEEDELSAPTLAERTQLTGATTAWSRGFSGAGQAIAILDTGVDKTHPFLAGKVVSEACYSSITSVATSLCPGGVTASTVAGSGLNCATGGRACAHGTHVAGVAAGRSTTFSGVAKDANVIAVQVFSLFSGTAECGSTPVPCALTYSSDQMRGMERVIELSDSMSVASVNMSLGGGQYSAACDAGRSIYKTFIDNLRSRGIATVVSSGNDSYTSSISFPACISTAVSVGSTEDGGSGTVSDAVSSFSNSASFLTLLAPGRLIYSSVPGGYSNYQGTSMAAPHVAGAFAILKQGRATASVDAMVGALSSTGAPVTDSRNSITKPRIRINDALSAILAATSAPNVKSRADFDGDGKTDISVFRPADGRWYVLKSSGGSSAGSWGLPTDIVTPGDFDGDGKADSAAYRPASGQWYVMRSSDSSVQIASFGILGDRPVAADYDGDGKTDIAQYRASDGRWYVLRSSDGSVTADAWGNSTDWPVAGDFDGDGRADKSIFRPATGEWYILRSTAGVMVTNWGTLGDKPVAADYDGDNKEDIAVYRPASGTWYILRSSDNSAAVMQWGNATDLPVPGDYDGDGKDEPAVYRGGTWYLMMSLSGVAVGEWGNSTDIPLPSRYLP